MNGHGFDPDDDPDSDFGPELEPSSDYGRTTREETLLCDVMLGSLVTHLRMCGYDAAYALDRGLEADDRLLDLARAEGRTLLTRDRELAARARADGESRAGGERSESEERSDGDTAGDEADGLLLESHEVAGQLREFRDAGYALDLAERPARCGRCNGPVETVADDEPRPEYAPDADDGTIEDVWRCTDCDQFFWKGSHWERVERTLADL